MKLEFYAGEYSTAKHRKRIDEIYHNEPAVSFWKSAILKLIQHEFDKDKKVTLTVREIGEEPDFRVRLAPDNYQFTVDMVATIAAMVPWEIDAELIVEINDLWFYPAQYNGPFTYRNVDECISDLSLKAADILDKMWLDLRPD